MIVVFIMIVVFCALKKLFIIREKKKKIVNIVLHLKKMADIIDLIYLIKRFIFLVITGIQTTGFNHWKISIFFKRTSKHYFNFYSL